jgi:hypothetical protein
VIRFFGVLVSLGLLMGCNKRLINLNQGNLDVNAFKFDYFSAKARLNYIEGGQKLSAIANLRIKYDSLIWISISPGLSIEAFRIKLTSDSVFLLDRLSHNYTKSSYGEFDKFYGLNLNFKWIQAMILGNPLLTNKNLVVNKEEQGIFYEQNEDQLQIRNFIGDQSNKIEKIFIKNSLAKYEIDIDYGDFTQLNEQARFPFSMKFILRFLEKQQPPKQINITIKSAHLTEKTLKFPFNVPAKYLKN